MNSLDVSARKERSLCCIDPVERRPARRSALPAGRDAASSSYDSVDGSAMRDTGSRRRALRTRRADTLAGFTTVAFQDH